jgi:hypothetical protein
MSNTREQIEAAVEATEILSPTTYAWFGHASPSLLPRIMRSMSSRSARDYLLYWLQEQLYVDFYCQGFATPTAEEDALPMQSATTPFLEALSSANAGTGCRENDWEILAIEECAVLARKDGLEVWAWMADCYVPPGHDLDAGTRIGLRLPKEYLNLSPGFYVALGNRELPHDGSDTLVRVYWHLTPDGAAAFLRSATTRLNDARLPFRLKVLRDPSLYTRCDAGVVYTLKRDFRCVSKIMAEVYGEVSDTLRPSVPAFTKYLAPGLGLAEDPGGGQSFGEHRCQLLADALISAYESGVLSTRKRMHVVFKHFEQIGLSLDAPFLNPGSQDQYDFEFPR